MRWCRLATDQGHAQAQYKLAVAYSDGDGISQNYLQAYMWYSLSAS